MSCDQKIKSVASSQVSKSNVEFIEISETDVQPIFPGCEHKIEIARCTNQKIVHHIFKEVKFIAEDPIDYSTVVISFIVDKNGKIINIKPLKGHTLFKSSNLIQVLERLPTLTPAYKNGETVSVRYKLPIKVSFDK